MWLPCLEHINTSPFCLESKCLNLASGAHYNVGPVSSLWLHVSPLLSSYLELLPSQPSMQSWCVMAAHPQALSTVLSSKPLPASCPFSTRVTAMNSSSLVLSISLWPSLDRALWGESFRSLPSHTQCTIDKNWLRGCPQWPSFPSATPVKEPAVNHQARVKMSSPNITKHFQGFLPKFRRKQISSSDS